MNKFKIGGVCFNGLFKTRKKAVLFADKNLQKIMWMKKF